MSENYRNPDGMTDLERQMASPLGKPMRNLTTEERAARMSRVMSDAELVELDSHTKWMTGGGVFVVNADAFRALRARLSAVEAQRDDLARQLEAAREGLVLADAALRGANMNMAVVERKVGAALKGE